MPIEFACEECKSVLRVPDGSSGKRSRCPTCKHEQEIPWVVSGGQEVVASDKLSIPCPKCQNHLVCSPDLLGTRGRCKKCQHIFTISTNPQETESTAPTLVFHCPKCNKLFEGNERMRGRNGKCDVCATVFKINLQPAEAKSSRPTAATNAVAQPTSKNAIPPREAPSAPKPRPTAPVKQAVQEEEELLLLEETPPKPSHRPAPAPAKAKPQPVASNAPIRFECTQCRGVMEVPGSTAGLETECPYCQTVQAIPNKSTPTRPAPAQSQTPAYTAPATDFSANNYGGQPMNAGTSNAFDPLGGIDLGAVNLTNPYAAPTQTWSAPPTSQVSRSSGAVSVGNVLQLGFNSLFPTCFFYIFHLLIVTISVVAMYALFALFAMSMRGIGSDAMVYVVSGGMILMGLVVGALSAWMAGCLSRMALDAVRQKPFNFGDAFNPLGAFNSAILVVGCGMLIMLIGYLPIIVHMTTGALKGIEWFSVVWLLLFIPVMMAFGFLSSLALFAGVDGESSSESIQTSMSIIMSHFGTALAVMILSGIISGLLSFVTFGVSYVIPVYMNAALYHLASKRR